MMQQTWKLATVLVAGVLVGCGASADLETETDISPSDATEPRPYGSGEVLIERGSRGDGVVEVALLQVEQLHAFDVGEVSYRVVKVDGAVALEFTAPLSVHMPAVEADEGGKQELTLLETFLALQPSAVPAPALMDAHQEEALALGRTDERILSASMNLLVEKDGANLSTKPVGQALSCADALAGLAGISGIIRSNEAKIQGPNISVTSPIVNKKRKAAGACNLTSRDWTFRVDRKLGADIFRTIRSSYTLRPGNFSGYVEFAHQFTNTDLRSVSLTGSGQFAFLAVATQE